MAAGSATTADRERMRRALALAERGWGRVEPNPLVGAVVVKDDAVVGTGFHGEYGGPHAEVAALDAAGERARGATLYVTLEPCSHRGKTPPCTAAVREAGIARLVYGAEDPHPEAGGGADRLREAGLAVVGGVERAAVRAQNAPFFHAIERGRAFVALKYGLSLDARIAAGVGETTDVTGSAAWREVHRLRAGFDAILVGRRTATTDDPRLTVRGEIVPRRPPVRVVADPDARLPVASRLVGTAADAPVCVVCARDAPAARREALERAGARVLPVDRGGGGLDPAALLDALWSDGVRSVLCEGGGRLGAALLAADRVQRLYLFYAPRIIGAAGVPAFPGGHPPQAAGGWHVRELRRLDDDVLMVLDRSR